MNRLLIVGKIIPGAEEQMARIFAESDATELPMITGVRHRSLYSLHDLYVHLVDVDGSGPAMLESARSHPLFVRVTEQLATCTSHYLPTWRTPRDAVARCFYHWDAPAAEARAGAEAGAGADAGSGAAGAGLNQAGAAEPVHLESDRGGMDVLDTPEPAERSS